jgi:hypothetical protein
VDQSTVVTSPLQTIEVDKYVFKLATTVGKVRNPAEVRPLHLLMRKPNVFFLLGISVYPYILSMLTRKHIANDGIVAAGKTHPVQLETRGSNGSLGNTIR